MAELWEYKVESVDVGRYYDEMLEWCLKPLGDQGWELVHITARKNEEGRDDVHLKAYFKRRKQFEAQPFEAPPADTDSTWLESIGFVRDEDNRYRLGKRLVVECYAGKWRAYLNESERHFNFLCDVDLRDDVTRLIAAMGL